MSEYSVVEAKNQMSALIDRARAGEKVVITRHGQPVVELRPVEVTKGPVSDSDIDWMMKRAPKLRPGGLGAVETLIQMREEDRLFDMASNAAKAD